MKVDCSVEHTSYGVKVTCGRCDHTILATGTDEDRVVRRCLALLRESCPEEESNFYVAEDEPPIAAANVPRGREVELLVRDKPLRPPGRRP